MVLFAEGEEVELTFKFKISYLCFCGAGTPGTVGSEWWGWARRGQWRIQPAVFILLD